MLPSQVRLHQIEGFYYVGRHGGFTRAAAAMPTPISEPAIHQQVRKLERALGVTLVVRGPGRRMVLTPTGRRLHEFVAPYFEGLPGTLRRLAEGEAGSLVIATESFYLEEVCGPALAALSRDCPQAMLRLVELDVPEIEAALRHGEADIAVVGHHEASSDLTFETLGQLGVELIVPLQHPLARRRRALRASDLHGLRLVAFVRDSPGRMLTERALTRAGIEVEVVAEVATTAAATSLVQAGLAAAFVPVLVRDEHPLRARRRGVVALSLTHLVDEHAEPPPFGLLQIRSHGASGLARGFARAVRVTCGVVPSQVA